MLNVNEDAGVLRTHIKVDLWSKSGGVWCKQVMSFKLRHLKEKIKPKLVQGGLEPFRVMKT